MQLIRGLHNVAPIQSALAQGSVLTIGNFDGVHLGHQRVLSEVAQRAKDLHLPSIVMLFEPLPIEFFRPEKAPVRIMNFREKMQALALSPIDYVLCVRFNEGFSSLSAGDFIESVLVEKLNVKHLVVGDDFRFGQNRQGDYAALDQAGQQFGFSVTDMATYKQDGERVSSTRIRQALTNPDLALAEHLLGKPFSFNGRVIHGQKLGRTIGFPTLNLNPKRIQMPVQGVFAVTVDCLAGKPLPGVANLGFRPTVDGVRPSIEVHLFNWNKDVYGCHVDVTLKHFIRPEQKFESFDALKQQIALDAEQAKQFFNL